MNNRSVATRNICFTNAVIQMLTKSGYAKLLRTQFLQFIAGKPASNYQGCKALHSLYLEHSNRERSAASVRKIVAQKSGKEFLSDGHQHDADEFMRAVITMMSNELEGWETFNVVNNQHVGKEKIKRKFLDNSSGVCSSDQEFLSLKLTIPCSDLSVSLSSLISSHFSEETRVTYIKCSSCCPHDNTPDANKVPCPQEGFCSRPSVSCCELIHCPKYLFIQLLRFGLGYNGQKVLTMVKFESELVMPNGVEYEVKAIVSHWGNSIQEGHYVTYLKNETGQ